MAKTVDVGHKATASPWRYAAAGWTVTLSARNATLDVRHAPSGVRLRGVMVVDVVREGNKEAWRVGPPMDSCSERLALVTPEAECGGYLTFRASEDRLRLAVEPRAWMQIAARLRWTATVRLGRRSFACRTGRAAGPQRVVQMASGPADSALNDSIFDMDRDVAVRFEASSRRIETIVAAGAAARFEVRLEAAQDAAGVIEIIVERDYYRSRYAPWYRPLDRKRCLRAPTGWMAWNTYFDAAGEKETLADARFAAKRLRPYGLDIWSIESWQENSETQPCRKFAHLTLRPSPGKFPHGMVWLARQIRRLGFMPGIWSVPFGTGDREFYLRHKDWFLHDAKGRPLTNWCGLYLLDPSQAAALRWVERTYRVMSRDWGYRFFKIDGMSAHKSSYSCMYYEREDVRTRFRRPIRDAYERMIRAVRRGIGPTPILLACGGAYTSPDPLAADAARIGHDVVEPGQPVQWRGYVNQVTTTLAHLFTNGILWHTDPDTLLVGEAASEDAARLAATVVALPGQLTFFGDRLRHLPKGRVWLLQRTLPVCDARPLDLYPIPRLCPVWTLKVRRPFGAWDVVSLFNFDQKRTRTVGVRLKDLGLDPKQPRLAFSLWDRTLLRPADGGFTVRLRPQSNAVLAVHPDLGRPQFVSTDRHLTQGATSLERCAWSAKTNRLAGACASVPADVVTLFFSVPDGLALQAVRVSGGRTLSSRVDVRSGLLTVRVRCPSQRLRWSIRFAPRAKQG